MSTTTEQAIKFPWIKDQLQTIETPFKDDFWGREALAERLTDYVSRLHVGATIAIDAEWGAGKSWFVQNWKAKLEQDKFDVIYLNAFNQDYVDDPFLTISMEIANAIKHDTDAFKSIKETIGQAYRAILPNLPMLLWYLTTSLVGVGAVAKPVADAVAALKSSEEFGEKAAELLNEKLQEHLSAQVENYENEKQSLDYFKTQLAQITSELDKPLIFIVDELDRCKPEFAIRLIERIKHFFDIPNVVFVLAINKTQLEEAINSFYGFTSASNYLEKFIDFSILLKNHDIYGSRYQKILEQYNNDLQLNIENEINNYYTKICMVYTPNPRQLIRILNRFSLLKASSNNRQSLFLFLILIYRELNLIEKYREIDFINNFLKIHESFFKKGFDTFKRRNPNWNINQNGHKFLRYLNHSIYSNEFTDLFESLFLYFESKIMNIDNLENMKVPYFPSNPQDQNIDLVEAWYNYIYMIAD